MTEQVEEWAVVELMGHVKLAGRVTEIERFGEKLGRVDIPQADGSFVTQYFGGGSIYRVRPVSEEIARYVAANSYEAPLAYPLQVVRPSLPAGEDIDEAEVDDEF